MKPQPDQRANHRDADCRDPPLQVHLCLHDSIVGFKVDAHHVDADVRGLSVVAAPGGMSEEGGGRRDGGADRAAERAGRNVAGVHPGDLMMDHLRVGRGEECRLIEIGRERVGREACAQIDGRYRRSSGCSKSRSAPRRPCWSCHSMVRRLFERQPHSAAPRTFARPKPRPRPTSRSGRHRRTRRRRQKRRW